MESTGFVKFIDMIGPEPCLFFCPSIEKNDSFCSPIYSFCVYLNHSSLTQSLAFILYKK